MYYQTFLDTITAQIRERVPASVTVQLHSVRKNNGVTLDGICIHEEGSTIAPNIYLNSFYEEYLDGKPMEDIVSRILQIYQDDPILSVDLAKKAMEWEFASEHLIFRLIRQEGNEALLSEVPWLPYLDLAITFHVILGDSAYGQMSTPVRHEQCKRWEADVDTLYQKALLNMPVLLPLDLNRVKEDFPFQILTNSLGLYGAATMLYPNVLSQLSDQFDDDLIIIPSSVHEVLILPKEIGGSAQELNAMVYSINHSHVDPEERLVDHIYYFNRTKNCVTLSI